MAAILEASQLRFITTTTYRLPPPYTLPQGTSVSMAAIRRATPCAWSFYILSRCGSDKLGRIRLNAELFQ
jgi:hypothetical protein